MGHTLKMKIISLSTFVLNLIMLQIEYVGTQVPTHSMSKREAEEECCKNGTTLFSIRELQNNLSVASEFLEQLGNGESAWVDGWADLSPFLSWMGCYSSVNLETEHTFEMTEKSVLTCFTECLRHNAETPYIGVENTSCFCMMSYPISLHRRYKLNVNHTLCNISCAYNSVDSCGGDSFMSVYGIYPARIINWAKNEPTSRPCVYLKSEQSSYEAYTASCYTFSADGHVCSDGDMFGSKLASSSCNKSFSYDDTEYCINEKRSKRQGGHKYCLQMNGTLSGFSAYWKMVPFLKYSHTYWMGPYRTFKLSENGTKNDSACIAVTKVDNFLYVEPDDCLVKKYSLCRPKSSSSDVSGICLTSANQPLQLSNVDTSATCFQNDTTVNPTIHSSEENPQVLLRSVTHYLSLIFSSVALLISVTVVVAFCKLKLSLRRDVSPRISIESGVRHRRQSAGTSDAGALLGYTNGSYELGTSPDSDKRNSSCLNVNNVNLNEVKTDNLYEGLENDRMQNAYEALDQIKAFKL